VRDRAGTRAVCGTPTSTDTASIPWASDGSDEVLEHEVATQPSGLGWLPDGDLVSVSMTDQKVLRFHDDHVATFADISEHCVFWPMT